MDISGHTITRHAADRLQQRGLRHEAVHLALRYQDRTFSVGRGCVALSLSRRAEAEMVRDGVPAQSRDRVRNLILVVADDTGAVITAFRADGRRARRYGGALRPLVPKVRSALEEVEHV